EQADAGIAVVAALRPGDFADLPGLDGFMRFPEGVVSGGVGTDLQDLFWVFAGSIAQLDRLIGGMGHWLFAIDMLSGFEGILGDFGVPVVGSSDKDGVYVLTLQQFAIIGKALALTDADGA